MSKAILVIDKPEYCGKCKLYMDNGNSYWCAVTDKDTSGFTLPASCPLKPMPKKAEIFKIYRNYIFNTEEEQLAYLIGSEDGYNDCIEELEKENG